METDDEDNKLGIKMSSPSTLTSSLSSPEVTTSITANPLADVDEPLLNSPSTPKTLPPPSPLSADNNEAAAVSSVSNDVNDEILELETTTKSIDQSAVDVTSEDGGEDDDVIFL
jgi:hypothetical protein